MSYAGLGQISTAPAATVGRSTSRYEAGGAVRVPARWAQRAANAGNRYNNSSAALIAVDGHAGPVTIGALRTLSHQFSSDQPVTNDPPTSRVTDNVIIPVALETALAARRFVPDPPVSSATRRTTTTTSGGTTTTPVTTPIPGATPAATPADEVILDEGSSTGVRGLIAQYGIWPWAIGGGMLVGVGLWFLSGGGMRANRRRVRRNVSRSWIVAIGNRGEYLKSYDYSPISGVGDYSVTKSAHDAVAFAHATAKSVARSISSGGGPRARAVQPGELSRGVRRNSCHHGKSIEDHREDLGYAIRSAMYFHKFGSNDQAREYALKAEEEAACLQPLPAGQQARLDAVLRTVKGVTRNYNYDLSHPYKYDAGGRPTRNGYRGAGFKRVPRVGTRVVFDPNPASLALYSTHPRVGEAGTVQTVAGPGGPMRSMRGPGGGLVYVDWDESRFQGVSLHDLSKVGR